MIYVLSTFIQVLHVLQKISYIIFALNKITLMLRKITLLQSASMCYGTIGPTTQNPPLVRNCRSNVGQTTVLRLLKL